MSNKSLILTCVCVLVVVFGCLYAFNPTFRSGVNKELADVQKADDASRYTTTKKVEDTCRAMMASYNTDRLTVEQYDGCGDPEKQGWADQAKMRANRTASTYNEFILKNEYVWAGNVPSDIRRSLEYLP